MSLTSSSINYHTTGVAHQAVRSGGVTGADAQPNAPVTLPQSNGVNITIINPTTNVNGSAEQTKLTPNPADSFTPSTVAPPAQPTMQALPALPPTTTADGFGYQQPAYY